MGDLINSQIDPISYFYLNLPKSMLVIFVLLGISCALDWDLFKLFY